MREQTIQFLREPGGGLGGVRGVRASSTPPSRLAQVKKTLSTALLQSVDRSARDDYNQVPPPPELKSEKKRTRGYHMYLFFPSSLESLHMGGRGGGGRGGVFKLFFFRPSVPQSTQVHKFGYVTRQCFEAHVQSIPSHPIPPKSPIPNPSPAM